SIVSARTETRGINRFTIVVDASEIVIEQVTKQLNKIVPVIKVVELDEESSVARGLMLVKVAADNTNRPQVVDAVNIFRARVVDVAQESVIVEATGSPGKLRALLDVLEPFGIRELIQSGHVALSRGPKAMAPTSFQALGSEMLGIAYPRLRRPASGTSGAAHKARAGE